jgi:hypothetical protein
METATKAITLSHLGPHADRYDLAAYAAELRETADDDVIIALRSDRIVIAHERGAEDAITEWTDRIHERGEWASSAHEAREWASFANDSAQD